MHDHVFMITFCTSDRSVIFIQNMTTHFKILRADCTAYQKKMSLAKLWGFISQNQNTVYKSLLPGECLSRYLFSRKFWDENIETCDFCSNPKKQDQVLHNISITSICVIKLFDLTHFISPSCPPQYYHLAAPAIFFWDTSEAEFIKHHYTS